MVLAACYVTGLVVNNLSGGTSAGVLNRIFPRLGSNTVDTSSLAGEWQTIRDHYVQTNVDGTDATHGAQQGLIDSVKARFDDRFSAFFTADQFQRQQQRLAGQEHGAIGVSVDERCAGGTACATGQQPTTPVIDEVFRDQPADRAGLRHGDILVKVDGKSVSEFSGDGAQRLEAMIAAVRGTAGTNVTLTVQRGDQQMTVTLQRGDLSIPSVYSQRFGPVLYLQVTSFQTGSGKEVITKLRDGFDGGARSVVLDLRNDPGGYVAEAQAIASQFLQRVSGKEETVVVRKGRLDAQGNPAGPGDVATDQIQDGGIALTQKLAVLIDGNTASAAEIVTAALKDYQRGVVVGQKTFGKGSVQQDFQLPDGSDLHLTVEKWFGPHGESIDRQGVAPDVTVALPGDDARFRLADAQTGDPSKDAQLQAALTAVQSG